MGTQTNHFTKVSATYHGLKIAQSKVFRKVWLEGDWLNVINNLNNSTPPSWSVEPLIFDVIEILNSFDDFYISHIFREGNGLADVFANIGVSSYRFWDEDDPLPIEALACLNNDYQKC